MFWHTATSHLLGHVPHRWLARAALLLCAVAFATLNPGYLPVTYAVVSLKPGDFVVGSDFAGPSVTASTFVIDGRTGQAQLLSSDGSFGRPSRVALGPNSEIYFADGLYKPGDGSLILVVFRVDPTTGAHTVISSLGRGFVSGLGTDRLGKLYIAWGNNASGYSSSTISEIDPVTGVQRTLYSSGGAPEILGGIALEADGSILTASSPTLLDLGRIVRIRPGTSAKELVATGGHLVHPFALAVSPDGTIFAADSGGILVPPLPRIVRIDPRSGAQTLVTQLSTTGLRSLGGITVDLIGNVFVSGTDDTGSGRIFRIDLATGQPSPISPSQPQALPPVLGDLAMAQVGAPLPCLRAGRSPVSVTGTRLGDGRLRVDVRAAGNPNAIRSIQLGTAPNAVIEEAPTIMGATASFVLRRTGPGPVTLPFTVTDACGEWKTFVGGGASSF